MKKLNSIIQFFVFLFPILLFLSYKGVQTLSYIILLFFILQIINKNNRANLNSHLDKKISIGLLIFIATPFIISIFSGGIMSRSDNYIYLYLLMFFPLVLQFLKNGLIQKDFIIQEYNLYCQHKILQT